MTIRKITTDAIDPGSITENLLHINVSNKVNAAYATANTANSAGSGGYDQANNAYAQANAAYGQANTARTTANDAYSQANTARSDANTTFATINTTFGTVNTNYQAAYAQANTARDTANNAYNNSNTKLSTSGGSISGDLAITGNLTVQGNATTINVTNLSVNDSMILLSTNAVGDSNDIGFIGHFDRDATATHAGLIRKATQNQFYLFDNYEVEPTNNVIDVAGNNFRVGNLRLGIINANSYVTAAGMDVTGQANAAYGQANAAYGQANSAYGAANNRVLKAGDTITGTLNLAPSTGGANVLQMGVSGQEQFSFETGISGVTNAALLIKQDNNFNYLTLRANSVGIGTTNPSGTLHVAGSIVQTTAADATFSQDIRLSRSVRPTIYPTGSSNIGLQIRSDGTGALQLNEDNAGDVRIAFGGGNAIVGTNVNHPSSKLFVAGPITTDWSSTISLRYNVSGQSTNYFKGITGTSIQNGTARGLHIFNYDADSNEGISFYPNNYAGQTANPAMKITSGGSVGIGTASPGVRLDVFQSTNDATIRTRTSGAGAWFEARDGISYFAGVRHVGADGARFWLTGMSQGIESYCIAMSSDGGTNRFLTINTSGNVGIGTASPGSRLHVFGGGGIIVDSSGATDNYYLECRESGTTRFNIYENSDAVYLNSHNTMVFRCNQTGGSGGVIVLGGGLTRPDADNTRDLGTSSFRWANIYTADLHLSNRDSSNDVDGTWGEWTIQEGETKLYLINKRNGKKYSFVLSEEE